MKNMFITAVSVALIFFTGFYTGQKFSYRPPLKEQNTPSIQSNSVDITSQPDGHSIKSSKQKTESFIKKTPKTAKRSGTASEMDEMLFPPEEDELTDEILAESEARFNLEKEAELSFYLSLLSSMEENNFPKEEIELVKAQIDAVESAVFEDTLPEQSDLDEPLTAEQMREDLSNSLKEAGIDISDEDREQMVNALFPDEEETVSAPKDEFMLPHEIEN